MPNYIHVILILVFITLPACAGQQRYYKSTRYSSNLQAHLNQDMAYCDAIAKGAQPAVTPYIPPSPTTTYGSGKIIDNSGNVYHGTYRQTTYPNENQVFSNSLNSFSNTLRASNIYVAVYERCLAELGWYQMSKEEYENSKPTFVLTSSPSGARIYICEIDGNVIDAISGVTPINRVLPPGKLMWKSECYKAVLGNLSSEIICRPIEVSRSIHFVLK